jgi:hypothetical protein
VESKETDAVFNICDATADIGRAMMGTHYEVQFLSKDGNEKIQHREGFPKNQETHEKFFEHVVYSSGGRDLAVIEGTFVATGTLKEIKGSPESELVRYLHSKRVFISEKRFETIKLKSIGYIHKVSPEFTHKPMYEAVVKDEFTEKLQEEGEDPDIEVPEIELIPKIVWARCPKTKRQVRAKCLEVRCEERHAPVVKRLMTTTGEEDDEDDSGSLVLYSFSSEVKAEMLRTQNEFNASLRGMKVDGIHKDVMYGNIPTEEGIDADLMTLYRYMLKVKNKEGTRRLFSGIDESPKTAEWGQFVFQCREEDETEAKKYLDIEFVQLYCAMDQYEGKKDAFLRNKTPRRIGVRSKYEEQWMAKMTPKKVDEEYERPIPSHRRKRTPRLIFKPSESDFPALNSRRPPKKNAWTERSVLSTKRERKIEEVEVTDDRSTDRVTTEGNNPVFSDTIANLQMKMKQIEAMQEDVTKMLSLNAEQMKQVMKMQETQTKVMNGLVSSVNQLMVRLSVIETLQAVPAEVREPQSNMILENCDEGLKTPPKTRTASKRTLSPEKETTQEKKRAANGGTPMRSEGRSSPVIQAQLDEMTENHDTSEHEDYAAEKDEIGFEDGTERNDDGSEKGAEATDTATGPSELRQTVDEFEKESQEKIEATKKAPTGMFESVCHSLFPDRAPTGGGRTSGRGGRGGGRTTERK